jgi:putative salt-induced outer membrane protein YdiY
VNIPILRRGIFLMSWLVGGVFAADEPKSAASIHEIRTVDGEVFRGELVHADATRLVLRSKAAGELTFATAEVVCTPPPLTEAVPPPPAWVAATPPPVAPEPTPVPVVPPAAAPEGKWRRSAEAGYSFQESTVSKRDVYLRAEATYEASDRFRYNGLVKYIYGEQEDQKSSDRLEALAALRHDLAKRWVFRGDLGYRNDHLRDLDLETTGLVGVQYLLFRHPRFRLSLGPGTGFRYRETDLGLLQGTRFNVDFVEDLSWAITERISLTQGASFLYDTAQSDAYRVRNNAALGARLTERVRANLRYEYEFDRARPVGPSRVDQRLFTTLGVEF